MQVNVVQAQSQPVTVVVTETGGQSRSGKRFYHNQSMAVSATFPLFLFGGMGLAMSLGWAQISSVPMTEQFMYSWFIGVIAGALVSAIFVTHIPKRYYYMFSCVCTLTAGIIFVSAPDKYAALLAARYIAGISIGLITVPFIIHSSEVATPDYRGFCSSNEQYALAIGIFIQVIYTTQLSQYSKVTAHQIHGIFGILTAAFALGSTTITIESPIFHLRQQQETQALLCQQKLTGELVSGYWTDKLICEARLYVQEGNSLSMGAALASSVLPFLKLTVYRCFVAFSISLPLTWTLQYSMAYSGDYDNSWPAIVWAALRLVGTVLTCMLLETLGRKFVSLLGLLVMAALVLTMAGIFATSDDIFSDYYMTIVCRVSMALQFFAGMFVSCTPTYLGEAFAMRVKPMFIALAVCFEQLVHIIVIVTFEFSADTLYLYYVIVGIILVIGLIIFGVVMPETRRLTLRQANERFQLGHNIMSY